MLRRLASRILWLALLAAGFNTGAAESVKILRWTTEDGLPQNRIACLAQTRDGYLWAGTWFGLARFDGTRFTVFNQQNTRALANATISALAVDSDGALWIGTHEGLVKYQGGKFTRFTTADGLPANQIWQMTAAHAGGIWLQADDKIVRCQHDHFTTVWRYLGYDTIHSLEENADGRLNIFLDRQWLVLSASSGTVQTNYVENFDPHWVLNGGLAGSPDEAFVGTMTGLRRLERGNTNAALVGGWSGERVNFLSRDRAGNVWAQSATNGLRRFDGAHWQPIELGEARSGIVCARQDAQGNLWFGTADGLVQLRSQKIRDYTTRDGLPDDNVWSVCESADGIIWAGTDRGLAMIQSNRVAEVRLPEVNYEQTMRCVWPAQGGGLWVALGLEGIRKWQNGRVSETILSSEISGIPSALYEDQAGRLWIGATEALYFSQQGRLQKLFVGNKTLREVHAICEDHTGTFWFGTQDGALLRWRGGDEAAQVSAFTARDGWPGDKVWSIHETADGAVWVGTEKGLVRFAHGIFFQFNLHQQMPEDEINCVLDDDHGALWCSTLHGIFRLSLAELNAVADGKSAQVQPFILGAADGMETPESNGGTQPAGWKARDGRLWFPTGKGVVVIDPKLFLAKENPPPLVLEAFRADGREMLGDNHGKIKIAAGRGQAVAAGFTASDLAAPEQVRFRTRLAGVADDWSEPMANRTAEYFDLRPGDYRFEAQARDHHGQWGLPVAVAFSIAPHFWQTWWFYLVAAIAVSGLTAAVQAYRLKWQHQILKLEEQKTVANERARIARDLHDDLGTALTGLALELDVIGRDTKASAALAERLGNTSDRTRDLAERMREVVWAANPQCDTVSSLASFLEQQVQQFLRLDTVRIRLDFPDEIPALPVAADARHQLALSVREALTNVVRHAQATEVWLSLKLEADHLIVSVKDNGRGFDRSRQTGNGLKNMRVRMAQAGGTFDCVSEPDQGTTVKFQLPLLIGKK